MKLSYLMKTASPVWHRLIDPATNPQADPEITSIHSSAQDVEPGGLFIAIKGFKADGHDYIDQALANGAAAVVTGKRVVKKESSAVMAEVKDTRKAMSAISARFYGYPSEHLTLIGITGTNGKTTTAWILESILERSGYHVGVIGTVNYRFNGQSFDTPITTPESIDLHRILADMRAGGVTHVVMEASSHAIDLHRVKDCDFDVAVFTNLTRDHLDYHKTMRAYFASKRRLFTKLLSEEGISVINMDDPYGQELVKSLPYNGHVRSPDTTKHENPRTNEREVFHIKRIITTSIDATTDLDSWSLLTTSAIEDTIDGLQGTLHFDDITLPFHSKLTGSFNLENILSAAGAAHALKIDPKRIIAGIEACQGAPGRLERVKNNGGRHMFVDYAHTPDALESILKTLSMRAPARLITLFGCGGDRDVTKRPMMGEIAARYSDVIIVTSDNPRTEDPETIISDIMVGVKKVTDRNNNRYNGNEDREKNKPSKKTEDSKNHGLEADNTEAVASSVTAQSAASCADTPCAGEVKIEVDRKKALQLAVAVSKPGDIVVAAGKGHETYQIISSGKIDFDDRQILHKESRKWGNPDSPSSSASCASSSCSSCSCSKSSIAPPQKKDLLPIPWTIKEIEQALYGDDVGNISKNKQTLGHILGPVSNEVENRRNSFSGISTDSRTISSDQLFVALEGERFDGHTFIPDLLEKGVGGFIVSSRFCNGLTSADWKIFSKKTADLFQVQDTLEALGKLANYQRNRAGIKVMAITGSSGKTTTRQMVSSIFEEQFSTLSTSGNFNNEIGLPLTLLHLSRDHEWAVVEMGMNHPGEISRLTRIARPDIALITNTAAAHLEGMGDVDNVARAKAEISEGLRPGSTLIINGDDPRKEIILKIAEKNKNIEQTVLFTTSKQNTTPPAKIKPTPPSSPINIASADENISKNSISFTLTGGYDVFFQPSKNNSQTRNPTDSNCRLTIPSPAPFMISNGLAASAAALAAGIPIHLIQKGLNRFKPVSGRMTIITKGNILLLDDTYNANPASVKGALETLKKMKEKSECGSESNSGGNENTTTIAVLGDMLELGEMSGTLHREVGKTAAESKISYLYCFGNEASQIAKGAIQAGLADEKVLHASKEKISARLMRYLNDQAAQTENTDTPSKSPQTIILIKGSRGMKMEEVLNTLMDQLSITD